MTVPRDPIEWHNRGQGQPLSDSGCSEQFKMGLQTQVWGKETNSVETEE